MTSTQTPATSHRAAAGGALAAYLLFLAFVLLNPSAEVPSSSVGFLVRVGEALHLPAMLVVPERVEFGANVLILVPLSLLGSVVLATRLTWRDWTALGFVLSGCVELFQGLFLSGRQASFSDVVANTSGALLGALAFAALDRLVVSRGHASLRRAERSARAGGV